MTSPKEQARAFATYLVESWNEVKPNGGKVTWPTLEEAKAQTWVVLGASLALGIYLFAVDSIVSLVVQQLLRRGGQA